MSTSSSPESGSSSGEVHERPHPPQPQQPQGVSVTQASSLTVDAIVDALLRRLQEVGVGGGGGARQPEHQHKLVFREDSAFCVDCDTRFSRVKNFNDKLRLLGEPHEGKPFLECPSCRPLFVKSLKDLGYDVSDLGDRLIIKRRRK